MLVLLSATTASRVKVEATSAAPSSPTKELTKDVVEVHVVELLISASWLPLSLLVLTHTILSLLIIDTPLVLILESLVGVCNLLELILGGVGVILILVRVVLDGELFEGFLDVLLRGVAFHTQQLVVVLAWRVLLLLLLLSLPLLVVLLVMLVMLMMVLVMLLSALMLRCRKT